MFFCSSMNRTGKKLCISLVILVIAVFAILSTRKSAIAVPVGETKVMNQPDGQLSMEPPALAAKMKILREEGLVDNLASANIDAMTQRQLSLTLHSYLDNTNALCGRKMRMGSIDDGGWEICDDVDLRPVPPCIIYSFGIAGDFSFDDQAASIYGCNIFSFDPSMKEATHQRSKLVMFYKVGLSGRTFKNNKGWDLKTLSDIRTMLNHKESPLVLKMDIESSEWDAVPQMFESGELTNVRQLLIEFHIVDNSKGYLLPRLKAIQAIEKAGFKKFYVHKNFRCKWNVPDFPIVRTMCYEVHYLKR